MNLHKTLAPVPTFYAMMALVIVVLAFRLSPYFMFVGAGFRFLNFLFWQKRDEAKD
jgi:hypothetical protein